MNGPPPETAGRIGPYKLLELLGEGGMGEVWLAEQVDPVHRRVALKVIKMGMDTKQFLARLEAERQALAVMDHPNIAQFFDGGATEGGRPYFVMELVQGVSLTDYCDTHRLTTEERIRLFVEVCQAVQHAHHKGVVHRDLKPTNVLVAVKDDHPVVKIIDFGIAKAMGQELTDRTLVTRVGQVIGTPEYMSPEQAEMSGLDVDTRTDVYSLGVMLYELLVGALPYDLGAKADQAIRNAIRDTEVPRPSTRLTTLEETKETIARYRRTTVDALRRELRTDLDWVILKAMEKDRTRRYETANGLALELERHLRHEPVLARAPSAGYRIGKFVKRHRVGVGAGVAITGALILGLTFATVGMVRAQRAERRAEEEAETSQQVSEFLVDLFEVNMPSEALGDTITAREILNRGAERVEIDLADQPVLQGRLMEVIGQVFTSLGLYGDAEPLLLGSLETRRGSLEQGHPDIAASLHALALLYRSQGRFEEALPLAREAVEIRERALGPDHLETATSIQVLGMVQRDQGDFENARANLLRSLEIREAILGPENNAVSTSLYHLGWLALREGDYAESKAFYDRSCAIAEKMLDPFDWNLGWCFNDLGVVSSNLGEYEASQEYYERALEIFERVLSPDHPGLGALLNNLGSLHWEQRNFEAARPYYDRALRIKETAFGPNHPETASALMNLALLLQNTGDYTGAYTRYIRALAIQDSAQGPNSLDAASVSGNLGYLLRYVGEYEEALSALERARRVKEEALGPDHWEMSNIYLNLGWLYRDLGRLEESAAALQRTLEIRTKAWGSEDPRLAIQIAYAATPLIDAGRFEEALSILEQAKDLGSRAENPKGDWFRIVFWEEARALRGLGRVAESDSVFDSVVSTIGEQDGEESQTYALWMARMWGVKGDGAKSLEWFEETVRLGNRDPWLLRIHELDLIRDHPEYLRLAEELRVDLGRE